MCENNVGGQTEAGILFYYIILRDDNIIIAAYFLQVISKPDGQVQ